MSVNVSVTADTKLCIPQIMVPRVSIMKKLNLIRDLVSVVCFREGLYFRGFLEELYENSVGT